MLAAVPTDLEITVRRQLGKISMSVQDILTNTIEAGLTIVDLDKVEHAQWTDDFGNKYDGTRLMLNKKAHGIVRVLTVDGGIVEG